MLIEFERFWNFMHLVRKRFLIFLAAKLGPFRRAGNTMKGVFSSN
jgi:hypothetical protein